MLSNRKLLFKNQAVGQMNKKITYFLISLLTFWLVSSSSASTHKTAVERILAQAPSLEKQALIISIKAYNNALAKKLTTSPIISIIDYSLPSTSKRLWVINLKTDKVLFHTFAAHGQKTGLVHAKNFSNRLNSHKTSIGFYLTQSTYFGKHGLSLRLKGLDSGFNNHAYQRHIVMHAAAYATESFIKKHGYLGRSWGCPAIPPRQLKPIINTIKNNTLLIAYYPNPQWLATSTLLRPQNTI